MELKYKGYTIKIEQDSDPIDPRENANIGTMVCFHNRYNLGDREHGYTHETLKFLLIDDDIVALPLYLLDHSGLWMGTEPFPCDPQGWDTSHVGYIFASKLKASKEGISEERLKDILKAEVEEYNDYLTGNVYGYVVTDKDGDVVSSCWGFIGDPEKSGVIDAAKSEVENYLHNVGEQMELFSEKGT